MRPILAVLLILCLAAPAAAEQAGPDDMNRCLCVAALSRLLCKKPNEMSFVLKTGEGLYTYSVHYAAGESRFTCAVTESAIYVRGDTSPKLLRTIPYTLDPTTMCGKFSLRLPECAIGGEAKCCAVKTAKQLKQDKEDAFWNRPIPDILQDELKTGTFGQPDQGGEPAEATPSAPTPAKQ
mgnify:CR=1 FL=1